MPATTASYTLSLTRRSSDLAGQLLAVVDGRLLDIQVRRDRRDVLDQELRGAGGGGLVRLGGHEAVAVGVDEVLRSEEHTSELQSQSNLVCCLLLDKKKAE